MKIELLADRPDTIAPLVDLFESTWGPYYLDGPGDARADLVARLNRDRLPIGLIALDGDAVIGTATVGLDVSTGIEPSVIGLAVAPGHRRRGVAGALVLACEALAASLGYERLHMSSSVLGGLLRRLGWLEDEPVTFFDGSQGAVFSRDFPK